MTHSTTQAPATTGGGLPTPPARTTSVTLTERCGDLVTVSTWETCAGVGQFVTTFLGEPSARHTANVKEP